MPGFFSARSFCFGRDREREVLDRLLGAGAQCVVIHGEEGVGKSRCSNYAVEAGQMLRIVRFCVTQIGTPVRGQSADFVRVPRLLGPLPATTRR